MPIDAKTHSMDTESTLQIAIRSALNGDAVLFLGAGAAKAAHKLNGDCLPTGQELSDALAKDCGLNGGYSLDSITEHFLDARSETSLINALRKQLTVATIDPELTTLASLPWARIWTTNYDDAFEKALDSRKVSHYSLTTAAETRNAQGNKLLLLHINGSLAKLKQALTPDFIVTSQSYATQSFLDSDWSVIFRNDLQRSKAIIFVGYSLADIDVARLIFNPEIFRSKIHFIDRTEIDPVLKTKLSRFGTVHPIGLEALRRSIEIESASWTKPDLIEEYQCFSRLEIEDGGKDASSDDDFYDLILRGVPQDKLMLAQAETPMVPSYTVIRTFEDKCIRELGEAGTIVAIVGAFANGKSIAIRSICLKLAAQGREVFFLEHPNDLAEAELQRMCKRDRDFVLVIENYSRNLLLVECFSRYARAECTLLISERAEVHELRLPALIDKTKAHRYLFVHDVDVLDNEEIDRLSKLLSFRGLWGERAGLSEIQRNAYLKHDCGSQMQAVLIDVANSPQVKAKLNEIVEHFKAINGGLRVLISLCLLQVIGEEPRISIVSELLHLSHESFRDLTRDEIPRQIVIVQSDIAQFRSTIMATAVLSGMVNSAVITEVIVECVRNAEHARRADSYFGNLAKEMMRFGTLERILPEKGKRAALQNLYEELKNIPSIRENPQFWLQYAMARLSLGELDVARRFFEQSYSFAKKIGEYDTYQIDNHYCRLLFLEAENATDSDEAFKSVNEALSTLKKQVLRENRYYPYRSVWNLEGVAKRHGTKWTDEQKKGVIAAAQYLMEASNRLDSHTARSVAVQGGIRRLQVVVEILSY
ncbi:SIR2 family protein [Nitrosomonas oligotropha]|uniref:SIR2 family protein n=1 Tax=Nitrosomonas oligotropha TaxID=42354 RepID=UPI0013698362|nr:SIR2 family protein [Nitrosomonas oligotropha]MXS83608.1 SIR2 family protein [Nitrosomonas oligotropha]